MSRGRSLSIGSKFLYGQEWTHTMFEVAVGLGAGSPTRGNTGLLFVRGKAKGSLASVIRRSAQVPLSGSPLTPALHYPKRTLCGPKGEGRLPSQKERRFCPALDYRTTPRRHAHHAHSPISRRICASDALARNIRCRRIWRGREMRRAWAIVGAADTGPVFKFDWRSWLSIIGTKLA